MNQHSQKSSAWRKRILLKGVFCILLLAGVGLAFFLTTRNQPVRSSAEQPNVVMILVDTLRSDHLSQNGYERETSPALDALANESIVFPQLTVNGSWTLPNIITLFSGVHPKGHRVEFPEPHNTKEMKLLPEFFQERGYRTSGYSANFHVSLQNDLDQGFDRFWWEAERGTPIEYTNLDVLLKKASGWITRHTNDPFFVYLQVMNVHGSYQVPDERRHFIDETHGTFSYYDKIMDGIMRRDHTEYRDQVNEPYLQDLRNQYDSAIRYTDEELAKFLQELKEKGLYDDTVIVIAADHGEELYDHQGFSHGFSLYQEIATTPLIIKPHKGASQEILQLVGKRFEHRGQQIDFLPTLLSLLNIPLPEYVEGENLFAHPDGVQKPILLRNRWTGRMTGEAYIEWPWKVIYTQKDYQGKTELLELYNLEDDPGETKNVAEEFPERAKELHQKMNAANEE